MDYETKKAAEFCRIPAVGHVVATKPPLKPLVRYRPADKMPPTGVDVLTERGQAYVMRSWIYIDSSFQGQPDWWAYLPEGDE
jgi:hypothetical protein